MDPGSEELARALLLVDWSPWVFPPPPGQGMAPEAPVGGAGKVTLTWKEIQVPFHTHYHPGQVPCSAPAHSTLPRP